MEKNHRLYLRNLPTNIASDDINEVFKSHGAVTNIEIKEKANALGGENKFAFVNITTTERKLNTCFNELKDLVINGCKVRIEIAKESFLARLQREREESKISAKPVPIFEEPKAVIRYNDSPQLGEAVGNLKQRISPKPEIVHKITKKPLYIPPQNIPKTVIGNNKLETVDIEPDKVCELDDEEQKKKNESDEKRLKSLMEKKMAFKMREGMIQKALNTVDQKPLGKKIIFSDDIGGLEKTNTEIKNQKRLFDDDDDDEHGDSNVLENNEFKIRENVNKKLRKLQSNFGNDKRFTLDNRFIEDEDNDVENNVDPLSGHQDERNWQLDILQNVLGKPMRISGIENTGDKNRKKGMVRYDPTKKDHKECEITVEKHIPKKSDKVKKSLIENGDIEKEKIPELSKDTFFNVSENLVDTLKQDGQFSFLKTFGTTEPSMDNPADVKVHENGEEHRFNFSTKNPFKYDSSDNESADEESAEKIIDTKKIESKNDWNDSLFFIKNDIRFDDGRKFFSKESKADSEFSTVRRNLKQIVRTKIQNNLRKKVTWKKTKQNKSR